MTRYDFIVIELDRPSGGVGSEINIISTDEDVIKWATEQIRKISPTVQVDENNWYKKFPQTKNLSRQFRKMNNEQGAIGFWLMTELCHNGWEPFGTTQANVHVSKITLRRCRDI